MLVHLGKLISERRKIMDMSLNALSQGMGGSPGASFLHRIESGRVLPTREVSTRLARALLLPTDVVLNAAGHAPEEQVEDALIKLEALIHEDAPALVHVPVYDPEDGESPTGERRPKVIRRAGDRRIVDLDGPDNAPYEGEVLPSSRSIDPTCES